MVENTFIVSTKVPLYSYLFCVLKGGDGPEFGNISLIRPPPTAPGNNETDYDPRLVVASREITYI